MSKIICDVCGTTYPETAAQCPICGCAKNTTQQTAAGEQAVGEASYAYVKGGRFSKTNVRKRYQPNREAPRRVTKEPKKEPKKDGNNTNRILAVVIVLLLLAIAAVLVYMGVRVFFPDLGQSGTQQTDPPQSTNSTDPTDPQTVPCTGVTLSRNNIVLEKVGDGFLLTATLVPADTTDTVTYVSSDPSVATVSDGGMVVAVSGGQAVITVTCGEISVPFQVECSFGDPTEPPTDPPTEPTVIVPAGFELKLNRKEFSLTERYPDPWALFKDTAEVKATDITWTVDDPSVASVDEKGVVSAVGKGSTIVRATFGDQTATCKIHVTFDPKPATEPKYTLSDDDGDVTLNVGDSFILGLSDSEGRNVPVEWTASEEGYVTINGKSITAVQNTQSLSGRYITVSGTVDGETYTCIIRIYNPPEEDNTET